jgi:hypothetical protein
VGDAGDFRLRGMCTYLLQMLVVTTRGQSVVAAVSFGECCAGGGVSGSLWRASEILEIRCAWERGQKKQKKGYGVRETALNPGIRTKMEEAEEGRREGNWAGGREAGSRGGRELTCSLKNGEKLVKGRENPRVMNRGKLLAMGYEGGEGSEVVEKETAKPQSGRRSQWSNSNAAADLPSVRTVPGCCALRKIAVVSAGMGPAHFD